MNPRAAKRTAARRPASVHGVDFTSAPGSGKAITLARAIRVADGLEVESVESLRAFDAFERTLLEEGPWVGGFDFPFGLPRAFLDSELDAPTSWAESMRWLAQTSREALRARFRAYCERRPVGDKFAHRATDRVAGSSPSMKWVNPPVAWMMKEGAPRLLAAGVHIPGLCEGDRNRVALEAYPALVARAVVGRASYKSDERAKQDADRLARRAAIVAHLELGAWEGLPVRMAGDVRLRAIEDGSGDVLDAVLCAAQAAVAARRQDFGIPANVDPLEGWIVGPVPRGG